VHFVAFVCEKSFAITHYLQAVTPIAIVKVEAASSRLKKSDKDVAST
jgi:hypothetical protein